MNLSSVNPAFFIASRFRSSWQARLPKNLWGCLAGGEGADMRYFEAGHCELACIAPSPLRGEGWGERSL